MRHSQTISEEIYKTFISNSQRKNNKKIGNENFLVY